MGVSQMVLIANGMSWGCGTRRSYGVVLQIKG